MSDRSFRGVRIIYFNDFELDMRAGELRRNGVRIRLQEQPLRILTALLERPGEMVTREEVRKRLWPNDTVVEVSHGINAAVQRLRDALGESADNPVFIETVPRRGYRFIAPVQFTLSGQAEPASPEKRPPQRPTAPEPESLEGKSVSHFRVMEKLGGGGMGVVYRAEDLTLGRQVAMKFLSRELAADAGALSRFRREAQAASALNHPNICTIHGVEECDGQPVIVMELLEGETLEAILTRGPLSVPAAVAMAIKVAAALDAAHRRGIVHRDIKPGNILVGKSGLKVLDFGLARMDRPVTLSLDGPAHVTQPGSILGTLHYMSPEQVQGKDADASGDIFSFGVVLYELLAGRKAFDGPNSARVMAAILALHPPPIVPPVPPALELILRRCLAKEPDERWQTARDLRAALEWVAVAPVARTPVRQRLAGLVGLGVLAAFLYSRGNVQPSAVPVASRLPTQPPQAARPIVVEPIVVEPTRKPDPAPPVAAASVWTQPGLASHPSLSPDGRHIAFTDAGRLYIRPLDSGEVRLLGPATGVPFWSPDSRSVAATLATSLMRFDLDGSAPTRLCASNTTLAGAWGPDGTILIGLLHDGLYRVPASGGEPVRVTTVDPVRDETRHFAPVFLPGGGRFLYVRASAQREKSMLYVGSLSSDERKEIMPVESNVEFVSGGRNATSGYLVFMTGGILAARSFDLRTLAADSRTIMLGEAVASAPTRDSAVGNAEFSVTPSALAFRPNGGDGGITLIPNWATRLSR